MRNHRRPFLPSRRLSDLRSTIVAGLLAAGPVLCAAQDSYRSGPLYDELARMDATLFDAAFVRCDAAQVRTIFAEDAEFYHDRAGVSTGEAVRTLKSCPREQGLTRTLVPGSLEVHEMKGYGAIQMGRHTFRRHGETGAEAARFVHLWKRDGDGWRLARVLSFDHRPAEPSEGGRTPGD
jgi:hypothetical protein